MIGLDKSKRLNWVDSLKGLLIILVILGHSIQYTIGNACYFNHLWNIIYSFHMPAFMAVSGFLAYIKWGGAIFYMAYNMEAFQTVNDSILIMDIIVDADRRKY